MTPHPLAKEAAEKISRNHVASLRIREANATIIHTTAVQPVVEAGNKLEKAILKACQDITTGIHQDKIGDEWVSAIACHLGQAAANWRTLTADKNGQQNAANGPRSDFDGKNARLTPRQAKPL